MIQYESDFLTVKNRAYGFGRLAALEGFERENPYQEEENVSLWNEGFDSVQNLRTEDLEP